MLKLSVRSCFRIWFRWHRDFDARHTKPPFNPPRYTLELCGFNADRWRRLYGRTQIAQGIKELFSKP